MDRGGVWGSPSRFLLPIILVCVIFWGNRNGPFVFDDTSAIKDNADVSTNPIGAMWENNFWGDAMASPRARHFSYRPLTVLTFRLNYMLHGLEPVSLFLSPRPLPHFSVSSLRSLASI
jgi:hypothetical protein